MSFLLKEYEIPFLGKVELIEATNYDVTFNGKYYAKNNELGKFCKNCNSAEELIKKTSERIKDYLKNEINKSKEKIINENERKGKLELTLEKANIIKKIEYDWLKDYQTDNELQLEYQTLTPEVNSEENK